MFLYQKSVKIYKLKCLNKNAKIFGGFTSYGN